VALEVSLESWLVARIVTFPVGLATLDATPVAVTTSFDPSVAWLELVIVVVLVGEPSAIAPPVLLLVVAWTPDVVLFAETVTFPPAARVALLPTVAWTVDWVVEAALVPLMAARPPLLDVAPAVAVSVPCARSPRLPPTASRLAPLPIVDWVVAITLALALDAPRATAPPLMPLTLALAVSVEVEESAMLPVTVTIAPLPIEACAAGSVGAASWTVAVAEFRVPAIRPPLSAAALAVASSVPRVVTVRLDAPVMLSSMLAWVDPCSVALADV